MEYAAKENSLVKRIKQSIKDRKDLTKIIKEALPKECSPALALRLDGAIEPVHDIKYMPLYEYLRNAFEIFASKVESDWLANVGSKKSEIYRRDLAKYLALQDKYDKLIKTTGEQKQK